MSAQSALFPVQPRFDSGVELTPADHVRLGSQLQRVLDVMADGRWYSVPELQAYIASEFGVNDPQPSLSAQIRNARKVKHGGHQVERRRVDNGYQFRLVTEGVR
jgi:hypothetical protein